MNCFAKTAEVPKELAMENYEWPFLREFSSGFGSDLNLRAWYMFTDRDIKIFYLD